MNAPALSRREPFRPQFHFTPQRHWINDPNGLVWCDGEYHLFYQYNPEGDQWGHMSWGHAVSPNLVDWEELPVAIPEDDEAMIFSGSVVVDTQRSSGFGRPGDTVMVACYTACRRQPEGWQAQHLAYSTDRGRTWVKHAGNPVLDIGVKDFRDPKVWWHEASSAWRMVVVLPDERAALFYGSPNLRDWTELSRFEAPFDGQGIWECPDLLALPTDHGGTVWVLKVDALGGHPSGETGARVFFGDFDGTRFTPHHTEVMWADGGSDFYAALSWNGLEGSPQAGRPTWLAWMNCHRYAKHTPTSPWRGAMTVPRELSASRVNGQWRLRQRPVPALQALRQAVLHGPTQRLTPGAAQVLTQTTGEGPQWEVQLKWGDSRARRFGLRLELADTESALNSAASPEVATLTVGYDRDQQAVFIHRSGHGLPPDPLHQYDQPRHVLCRAPSAATPLDMHLLIDWSSVELWADGGLCALTEQWFGRGRVQRLSVFSQDGDTELQESTVWALSSARWA